MRSLVVVLLILLAARVDAQSIRQQATLLPQAPSPADHAGGAVGVNGVHAFLGVPDADLAGVDSGAVDHWRLVSSGWTFEGRFHAPDSLPGDHFGAALACTGTTLVVGAPGADVHGADSGAVYSYDLAGGSTPPTLIEKLAPADTQSGDGFGAVLALEPDTSASRRLAVGVPEADPNGPGSGAVYAYQRAAFVAPWTLTKKHVGPIASAGAHFGAAVAINVFSYGRLVVGAPDDDDAGADSGSVWQGLPNAAALTKLSIPGLAAGDRAGTAVALNSLTCVGLPGCDQPLSDAGKVWMFDILGTALGTLQPNGVDAGDAFGTRIAGNWNTGLLIGAPGDDGEGVDAGAAYLFGTDGTEFGRVVSPTANAGQRFGEVLAYSPSNGDLAIVGDPESSLATAAGGAAELFVVADESSTFYPIYCAYLGPATFPPCPCSATPPDRGCPNSAGPGALLHGSGTPSVTCDTLQLVASEVPLSSVGILIQGSSPGNAAVNGDGRSCFGSNLLRVALTSTASGSLSFGYGTTTAPLSVGGQIPAGGSLFAATYYQVHYRDPSDHCTSATHNLTNGLIITWGP